jgi:plastocyanin
MRRPAVLAAAAAAALALQGAAAPHPGHGPTLVSVRNQAFTPAQPTVAVNDAVIWTWDGLDRNHSVTADPGQAETFDSDPSGAPSHPFGSQFTHTFTREGRFTYFCRVHPGMRGAITVQRLPDIGDVTGPRVTSLRLRPSRICPRRTRRCRTTRARLGFTIDETADLVVRIERRVRRRWRRVRTLDASVRRGRRSIRLGARGLAPGRYRVSLRAYDLASNASRVARVGLVVRRP